MKKYFILFIIISINLLCNNSHARRAIPKSNLGYPVLLILENGRTGSGFYLKHSGKIYLITAKHVIYETQYDYNLNDTIDTQMRLLADLSNGIYWNSKEKKLYIENQMTKKDRIAIHKKVDEINLINARLHEIIDEMYADTNKLKLRTDILIYISYYINSTNNKPNECRLSLREFERRGKIKYNTESDVVAIEIANIEETEGLVSHASQSEIMCRNKGDTLGNVAVDKGGYKLFENVLVSNDVYMFGYPTSLVNIRSDIHTKLPLMRKGIVAGKNVHNKRIIIDCPVYYGNSGGLVIEVDTLRHEDRVEFLAIGIISKFIPFINKWFENSGYAIVVPMDDIIKILEN